LADSTPQKSSRLPPAAPPLASGVPLSPVLSPYWCGTGQGDFPLRGSWVRISEPR